MKETKMLKKYLNKLEDPNRPLLGPNVKALQFWGLLLPDSTLKRYFYLLMHVLVTIFTASEFVDIYFIKSDLNLVLNNLKITIISSISVMKIVSFIYRQEIWRSIIYYVTRADLNMRVHANERKILVIDDKTKYCRIITYFYWFLLYATIVIIIFTPICQYLFSRNYRECVKNGTVSYTEVVSSWVPFDKTTFAGYLAASAIQTYGAIYGGGWITSFDTTAMVIMVFFRLELEMLRIDAGAIFGDENEVVDTKESVKRLRNCHKRHVELIKYARLFDACLSPIMLLYMFVCSVMLCVTAYQITIETSAAQKFLTTEYLAFGVAQLFMYCWHSNDVLYTSQELIHGPYESIWWSTGDKRLRKNILMLMGQFTKTVVFSAGPFSQLTLPTFLNILKGAYSYYTLLSKSHIK